MRLTRRSLLASILVAPLIPARNLIAPPVQSLGPGWMPLSEFTKTMDAAKAFGYRFGGFGVWENSLIIEAQRKTYISQLFGPGNVIEPKEVDNELKGGQ